ncbi:hypothetical protein ACFLZC_02735 [Patescibacteria group bacterium]
MDTEHVFSSRSYFDQKTVELLKSQKRIAYDEIFDVDIAGFSVRNLRCLDTKAIAKFAISTVVPHNLPSKQATGLLKKIVLHGCVEMIDIGDLGFDMEHLLIFMHSSKLNDHVQGKVFFSHSITTFNTPKEEKMFEKISQAFLNWQIINPAEQEHKKGWGDHKHLNGNGVTYYYRKVFPQCHAIIVWPFADSKYPWRCKWDSRMKLEGSFFRREKLPVFEIDQDGFIFPSDRYFR